ncbi:MAG TPA: hypothetical protein VIJ24_07690, partial [Verrucomicrobiae bacterium]
MKSFSVILVFILAAFSAVAQTDTNAIVVPAETHAPAFPPATNGVAAPMDMSTVAAPVGRNAATREMSLEDCIREALQHNLDVQIERYSPQVSLYNLRSAYGGYDPLFNISGQHDFNVSPGGFTSQQIPIPSTTSKSDSFNSGINGLL